MKKTVIILVVLIDILFGVVKFDNAIFCDSVKIVNGAIAIDGNKTDTFPPDIKKIHMIAHYNNASPENNLTIKWIAINAAKEPNLVIYKMNKKFGKLSDSYLHIYLQRGYNPFPPGDYKVELLENNKTIFEKKFFIKRGNLDINISKTDSEQNSTNQNENKIDLKNIKNKIYGDLNGDGKKEVVSWQKFASNDLGDFYQLSVFDANGTLLWKGPEIIDTDNRYIFGSWDFGESFPEALIDIDEDNRDELLAPSPQSDVSPIYYRILKWKNNQLVDTKPYAFMQSKNDKDIFEWINPAPQTGDLTWISKITKISKNRAKVEITNSNGTNGNISHAIAIFKTKKIQIVKWIESSKSNSYIAKIGLKDLFNSNGELLKTVHSILQQDRANFYNGAGDKEDKEDRFFKTYKDREKIKKMQIVSLNMSLNRLKNIIFTKHPLLKITFQDNKLLIETLKE